MSDPIHPRKIEGWEFFNDHVGACDSGEMSPFGALAESDRQVPEFFIQSLSGCGRVLDLGCGGGYPGLYVAPHVRQLVGLDAAPNMIAIAKANASRLGTVNAVFEIGGADGTLPYADEEFDGAMLCGVLESMDWESVRRIMPEVRRVLAPGARVAALDQDWQERLTKAPMRTESIRLRDGKLVLQVVERSASPHTELDTRYYLNPQSELYQKMLAELGDRTLMPSHIGVEDLNTADILDAEYDEMAQFDAQSLAELFASYGFTDIVSEVAPVSAWGQNMVLLSARRR